MTEPVEPPRMIKYGGVREDSAEVRDRFARVRGQLADLRRSNEENLLAIAAYVDKYLRKRP